MGEQLLDIVNEDGAVVGQASREDIHKRGLLHREVHVWFYSPNKEIIFQHRALDKDTYPDKLDATVGGHVEQGQSFEEAAIREVEEETGLKISKEDLEYVKTERRGLSGGKDPATGNQNNALRAIYAYKFTGDVRDLQIEGGKGLGFESWSIEKLKNLTDEEREKFIEFLVRDEHLELYQRIIENAETTS